MPEKIGLYIAAVGAVLAFCVSIPIKKTIEEHRLKGLEEPFNTKVGVYYIQSPNKSELEIKFNGKEKQQIYFGLMKRRTYEPSGTGEFVINHKIAANSIYKHKLESDSVYQIIIRTDLDSDDLKVKDLNIEYKRTEYHHLSERYFQFFLTIISIGFIIYYSK